MKLKRDISTIAILFASAGGMIGCGWLFSPFYAAQIAGVGALIAWGIAFVFMLLIALPLCEIGALYPISGGLSNYPKYTHGTHIGFIFSWIIWLSYVVMTPIEIQSILQYGSIYFPELTHKNRGFVELTTLGYSIAVILMVLLVIVNQFGIKLVAKSNVFISVWKFFVPLLAIFGFIYYAPSFQNLHVDNFSQTISWHSIFSALALGGIAFAFTGFQNGLMLAGEVKNPHRNIPISIIGAVVIGFIIYFLLQFAFIVAIPQSMLKDGFAHLNFAGESGPLVGLGIALGLGLIVKFILLDSMVSPFGTALVYTTATSRILYGMAENNFLPKAFLKLNKHQIPYFTLIINFIFGLLVFFPFPSWQKMVSFLSSASILSYGVGSICLLALRKQKPNFKRHFSLSWHTIICYLSFFVCNLMLYWCSWEIIFKLFIAIVIGLIISFFMFKNEGLNRFIKLILWFFLYVVCLCLVSYLGSFGGVGVLLEPFDYIALLIISVFFLNWSTYVAVKYNSENVPEPTAV